MSPWGFYRMQGPYAEYALDASDVCNNCLRLVRVGRVDPTRDGLATEYDQSYERNRRTTSVEYAPAEASSQSKGVFCECGVESARERIWSTDDRCLTVDRIGNLLQNCIQSLEHKGVSLDRETTIKLALSRYKKDNDPDAALSAGVKAGIAVASSQSGESRTAFST